MRDRKKRKKVLCAISSEVSFVKLPTSCSLLNMQKFTGEVHDIWKPFLDAVHEEMHQCLLTILCLCVCQLTQHIHHHILERYFSYNINSTDIHNYFYDIVIMIKQLQDFTRFT